MKKNKTIDNMKLLVLAGFALLMQVACTKELPYKQSFKEEVQNKSAIDTEAEYLMSSSMLKASRSSADAFPFMSADNKRVKLEWGKDSLRVLEMEKDERFKGNQTNNKLVLEIPVEHVAFGCAKDRYGECTNSEEALNDINWQQKNQFKFKAEALKSAGLSLLPILIDKDLGSNCHSEISARVLDVQLESSALNLTIERTFKTSIDCVSALEELSDLTTTAQFHYSLVKIDSILSQGFKPISYPAEDENTFGFFSTQKSKLDAANNSVVSSKQVILNHWNPKRSEIVYYLSDEFAKPENKLITKLTKDTVQNLNQGLQKAGVHFRIKVEDPSGKNPGDIRHSMIVLVEDPVASSVIGYGPQTEDPVTGEIVSAKTVMFLGTIKKFIKYTYDDILRHKRQESKEQSQQVGVQSELAARVQSSKSLSAKRSLNKKFVAADSKKEVPTKDLNLAEQVKLKKILSEIKDYKRISTLNLSDTKGMYKYLHEFKNCSYVLGADLMNREISGQLASQFSDSTKAWEDLSEEEKQKAIEIILPHIWIPTLIHEMGHNLGLRHNFQGSEDADNFYTAEELAKMGADYKMPFSSVMEYGDDLKALTFLGKYDIAALKFAYLRQVELASGETLTLEKSIADLKSQNKDIELKAYGYCTDEHAGINAGCRRFDLGTSYTEIVKNEIQNYEQSYLSRNFRSGAANFSLVDDVAYAARIKSKFVGLRLMQEVYERIKYKFNLEDQNPLWEANTFLADLKQASFLSAQFLMKVLATPDVTCAIAEAKDPQTISQVVLLSEIDSDAVSCFDLQLNEKFMVLGQYGKHFQSKKDPKLANPYADQIDIRGIWLDKLMASRVLFQRSMGISTLDENTDNFMDRTDLADELKALTYGLLLNQVSGLQAVQLATGETLEIELPMDSFQSHEIKKPLYPEIARALGISNQKIKFNEVFVKELVKNSKSESHELKSLEWTDSLSVYKTSLLEKAPEGHKEMVLGNSKLVAGPQNKMAYTALENLQTLERLGAIERTKLVEIYLERKKQDEKNAGQQSVAANENEKFAWEISIETLEQYLLGLLGTKEFNLQLLTMLPN